MSSPAAQIEQQQQHDTEPNNPDEQMEDMMQDHEEPNRNAVTTDHEVAATQQSSAQPAPNPIRKDVTLREFLGKMDDYAPIV